MEHWAVLSAGEKVRIDVRQRANARRLSLRVNQTDGRVSLSAPKWVSKREIDRFLQEHRHWLDEALDSVQAQELVAIGGTVPVEGRSLRIEQTGAARGTIRQDEASLWVPGRPETATARVRVYLRELARDRLTSASTDYARELGRRFSRITLRDPRSRWGSCSSSGGLMYSWRLIMAPPQVLAYVAAHEVAHLAEMNHSARFWAEVARLMPEYETPRAWLREHGRGLHRWKFEE